jgi:hypothetical protein
MEYDNTNSGAAFAKDNANPKAPKWSGPLNVDGKDYEVSIWERTSKAGKPFLSLKVGPVREKKAFGNKEYTTKPKQNNFNDDQDIPF